MNNEEIIYRKIKEISPNFKTLKTQSKENCDLVKSISNPRPLLIFDKSESIENLDEIGFKFHVNNPY